MFPGKGKLPDPQSPIILIAVSMAFGLLLFFWVAGTCMLYRKEMRPYRTLAQAVCDSGTSRVRFLWFPPVPLAEGQFHGRYVYFKPALEGKHGGTQFFVEGPVRVDFKADLVRWRQIVPQSLQAPLAPVRALPQFVALGTRSRSPVSFKERFFGGFPRAFRTKPGMSVLLLQGEATPAALRHDLEVILVGIQNLE